MFSIINDNGNFIRPNVKSYIGVLEFETINNTYFNIEEKEHIFNVDDIYDFKIISQSNEPIKDSKKIRLETPLFNDYNTAMSFLNRYLTSIRAYLIKSGYKCKAPLTPKIKEVTSSRANVGMIEIELLNGAKLHFIEKERFHNENDFWYRLYNKQGMAILSSSHLNIETDAFNNSDEARNSIKILLQKLSAFLGGEVGDSYKISEQKFFVFMSGLSVGLSVDCEVNLSLLIPFKMKLSSNDNDEARLMTIIDLLEYKGFDDLSTLYNILELIQDEFGKIGSKSTNKKIEDKKLALASDIDKFSYSVNCVDVVGIKNVRHGAKFKGNPSPNKALTVAQCREIMRSFINNWLDYKIFGETENNSLKEPSYDKTL